MELCYDDTKLRIMDMGLYKCLAKWFGVLWGCFRRLCLPATNQLKIHYRKSQRGLQSLSCYKRTEMFLSQTIPEWWEDQLTSVQESSYWQQFTYSALSLRDGVVSAPGLRVCFQRCCPGFIPKKPTPPPGPIEWDAEKGTIRRSVVGRPSSSKDDEGTAPLLGSIKDAGAGFVAKVDDELIAEVKKAGQRASVSFAP